MGLIKAITGAAGGVLADQWKEFFYCDSIASDILIVKGQKRTSGRSSNTRGEDNIISNGSGIAVADGQCMMIVEQGKVVELCAEPGEFTWNSSTEPSIFAGSLGESILETFKAIGKRFTYGGDTGKDQRVYYFNTKEILDNKFGTANPISFRVVDSRINFDVDVSLRCNGTYTFRITDPIKLYTNVTGNVAQSYSKNELRDTMKTEFISALGPALAKLSMLEIRPNQIPAHTDELEKYLNEELSAEWGARGIGDVKVAINPPTLTEEDQEMLKTAQKTAMYRDPTMAAATLVGAQADAMKTAAGNSAGAMTGFMGMGMAMNAGGMNAQNLFAMGQQQQQAAPAPAAAPAAEGWKCACGATATGKFCPECGAKKPDPKPAGGWRCKCGAAATGKFCPECGSPKPADDGWTCSCGAVNKGKFCAECGARKPAGVPQYKCDKCGWEPEKGVKPPKFCPECGDPFDDGDIQ
ncbi:MAG: SPFH domain-containing protein [Ruminococcaceae bacterium]|nr:SPFH domain-containing protein [Oscillospiraceae bacterium]